MCRRRDEGDMYDMRAKLAGYYYGKYGIAA